MGLGLLGRGVGDAAFLAKSGADLIITDLKSAEDLAPSRQALEQFPSIRYTLGRHELSDFVDRDLVLVAPKTPQNSPFVAKARASGAHVTMSSALFAKLAGITTVGITGTRGKTTTTQMIAHVLRKAGKHVLLGGNIQNVSTLALLPEVTKETIAILELDSWQLQGFRDEGISPNVAVFTTFYPDHLDYYEDMKEYLADKAELFLHQKPGDTFVLGSQAREAVLAQYPTPPVTPVMASTNDIDGWKLIVPGEHNRENAAAAFAALLALGLSEATIREGLESFAGVPGRLEHVREVRGIAIYNDTTATTPEATLAALRALDTGNKNIVLIMGGSDKGLAMEALALEIQKKVKRVVMLAGTGTNRILPFLEGASVFDDLQSALIEALAAAGEGDSILFSPAFASFGMFKNEYDRGEQFTALVRTLS